MLYTGGSTKEAVSQKNQYHCFFRGAPKISRINACYTYTLGK